jgi:hypothetical protein
LEKATAQGLKSGETEIPADILKKVADKENPWESEKYVAWVKQADTDFNGKLALQEYLDFNRVKHDLEEKYVKQGKFCNVDIGKDLSTPSEEAKEANRKKCAAVTKQENCFDQCRWNEPFDPKNEFKQLVAGAKLDAGSTSVPRDKFVELSKQKFPDVADKMDGWADKADGAGTKDAKITESEYERFRTYIHNVGSDGCVSKFEKFEEKAQVKAEQFSQNALCKSKTA